MAKGVDRNDTSAALVALAKRHHGCVTRGELLTLGVSPATISAWIGLGRLFRVHSGVYALGRPLSTPLERAAAAVLACGLHAELSHFSALALWRLSQHWPAIAEVTVPGRRRKPGIAVHRSRCLIRTDIRVQLGIRVTSPARTIFDCAPRLTGPQLARVVADARRAGLLHPSQLDDAIRRFANHPGKLAVIELRDDTQAPTRSSFEDMFGPFCRRYGLPAPQINMIVNGREVDAYFPAERVIVELDSWQFHRERPQFESDRDHDADALVADLVTYRLTWTRFMQRPEREAGRLRAVLANRHRPAA